MKKILFTLLAVVVVAGILGVTGLTAYRYGYAHAISNSDNIAPSLGQGNYFQWHKMPMHDFENGMRPGFGRNSGDHMMMGRGDFGFFAFFGFLVRLAVIALLGWLIYRFAKGWRLTITPPASTPAPAAATPPAEETVNPGN